MKRLQNRIAESGWLLPSVAVVGIASAAISLLGHLTSLEEWASLLCFAMSAYMMVEMSNANALLRVRSRMVTSTFVMLSVSAGFLVGPIPPVLTQLSFVAAALILFTTYQDKRSVGRTFYSFLFVGLASCTFVQTFFLIPVLWVLMATQLQSLSWRTWAASVLGVVTPYWLMLPWLVLEGDFTLWTAHARRLVTFAQPFSYAGISVGQVAVFAFTMLLCVVGMVHFWSRSYEDKIRIRLLYGFFSTMSLLCGLLLVVQPQHFATLMRLLLVFASPLVAHFFTHTSSRLTNVCFVLAIAVAIGIAALNLLGPSVAI